MTQGRWIEVERDIEAPVQHSLARPGYSPIRICAQVAGKATRHG